MVSGRPMNETLSKEPATAPAPAPQRQTLRVVVFGKQSSWTPEAIAGIVFGVLMFVLGLVALWQSRNHRMILIADIESHLRLHNVLAAPMLQTDPDLWVPPYEPPREFVYIADPPGTYADAPLLSWGGEGPKKPAPKPKPPQPRDGYEVEVDLTDMLPDTGRNGMWTLGGEGPKKPQPKPKPPQPRDGYGVDLDECIDVLLSAKVDSICSLSGQGPQKPKPKPQPPQPRDGYKLNFVRAAKSPSQLSNQH
ncbi:hypothetical protein G7Y79_00002g006010 [Physcia stellaris]|nr:hypothetical protein G7Y79_00002g006010 [Physcia stellaris]